MTKHELPPDPDLDDLPDEIAEAGLGVLGVTIGERRLPPPFSPSP